MKLTKLIRNKLLLCVLVLALCLTGCSNRTNEPTFTYEGYPYSETSSGYTSYAIKEFSDNFYGDVVIPTEYNGLPVERILWHAFQHGKMKSVRMESIVYLDRSAFAGCENLTNVELGRAETIGEYAFASCENLTDVELGRVETIGESAFTDCTALEKITIPASVKRIERFAFSGCIRLVEVFFEGEPEYIDPYAFESRDTIFGSPITMYGPANSIVETYARNEELDFCEWYPGE